MEDKPIINIVASQCHPDDEEKFNQDVTSCRELVAEITGDDYDSDRSVDVIEVDCTEVEMQNILFAECVLIKGWQDR